MDAAQVLQAVFSIIQPGGVAPGASPALEGTNGTSQPPSAPATSLPTSLPQIVLALLSLAAVRDWIKLLLLGSFLEFARRGLMKGWERLVDNIWVVATFEFSDDSSDWLMFWLSKKKVFQHARSIEVSAYYFGLDEAHVDDLGENEDGESPVAFLPSLSKTYTMWYKGCYMTIRREQVDDVRSWSRSKEVLEIRMLTRSPRLLRELLMEARKSYKKASEHLINVYVAEGTDRWKRVATQEKRPASSVILDPGVIDLVLDDARDFLNSRKWYADRGIPFRRGYLLYGAPGAGKTSMIHCIAGELGLHIYILSLTVVGLDDNSLKSLISRLPRACIVLIEDIDAAFTHGMKRDIADPEATAAATPSGSDGDGDDAPGAKGNAKDDMVNRVTLSGLLNALDGIAAQEGRILFATTNDYAALDAALLRPGRLDLHVEFQLASAHQAEQLFARFYTADGEPSGEAPPVEACDHEKHDGVLLALPADSRSEAGPQEPPVGPPRVLIEPPTEPPKPQLSPRANLPPHKHQSRLSQAEAAALASAFAAAIPPRTFSMATLQGYLMTYKVRPHAAVADAPAWVSRKTRERDPVLGSGAGAIVGLKGS